MARDVLTEVYTGDHMISKRADSAVLGLVSMLYSIAVFFLKQRKA